MALEPNTPEFLPEHTPIPNDLLRELVARHEALVHAVAHEDGQTIARLRLKFEYAAEAVARAAREAGMEGA